MSHQQSSFEYILCSWDTYEVLDITKVCDVVLFAFSCKNIDIENWKKDPDVFAHAIDDRGYEILNLVRG